MSWKDVLAIIVDAEIDEPAIAAAEAVARQFDAHFAAAFLTALPDEPLAYEPTVVAGVWAELLGRARQEADSERRKVEARIKGLAKDCELRTAEALSRDLGRVAAVHARYADITVVTRPVDGAGGDLREEIIEGVLFHSGRPVLVTPPGKPTPPAIGKRIMVAWDASREATRAVSEAQPFIDQADLVTVLTVDAKPKMFGHGDAPGANIAAHLARAEGRCAQCRWARAQSRQRHSRGGASSQRRSDCDGRLCAFTPARNGVWRRHQGSAAPS